MMHFSEPILIHPRELVREVGHAHHHRGSFHACIRNIFFTVAQGRDANVCAHMRTHTDVWLNKVDTERLW